MLILRVHWGFLLCAFIVVSLNGMTQTSISRVIQNVKKDISLVCVSVRQFEYVEVLNLFVQTERTQFYMTSSSVSLDTLLSDGNKKNCFNMMLTFYFKSSNILVCRTLKVTVKSEMHNIYYCKTIVVHSVLWSTFK